MIYPANKPWTASYSVLYGLFYYIYLLLFYYYYIIIIGCRFSGTLVIGIPALCCSEYRHSETGFPALCRWRSRRFQVPFYIYRWFSQEHPERQCGKDLQKAEIMV